MIRLIHIDDEEIEFSFVENHLRKLDDQLEMTWASSLQQARQLMAEQPFDCLLCDYQLPHSNGLEFLRELRKDGNTIPFILYTGHGDEALAVEAFRQGADDYYPKEIGTSHYNRLINSIRSHVEKRRAKESRRQAIEALERSERRFREIIQKVEQISIQGYNEDHRVVFWNKASERIYGYTEKEALGQKLEEIIIPPEMREEVSFLVDRWLNEGTPIPAAELVLLGKGGRDVPVYSSHVMLESPAGKEMYCIDVDLTATFEFQKQRQLMDRVFQQSSDLMIVSDGNGTVIKTSDALQEFIGNGSLIGKPVDEVRRLATQRDSSTEIKVISQPSSRR